MLTPSSAIDIQKCTRIIGNEFDLILTAAYRARELRSQRNPMQKYPSSAPVQALRDIEAGIVGRELLRRIGRKHSKFYKGS